MECKCVYEVDELVKYFVELKLGIVLFILFYMQSK